jgi:hypothetical protein
MAERGKDLFIWQSRPSTGPKLRKEFRANCGYFRHHKSILGVLKD